MQLKAEDFSFLPVNEPFRENVYFLSFILLSIFFHFITLKTEDFNPSNAKLMKFFEKQENL